MSIADGTEINPDKIVVKIEVSLIGVLKTNTSTLNQRENKNHPQEITDKEPFMELYKLCATKACSYQELVARSNFTFQVCFQECVQAGWTSRPGSQTLPLP